MSKQTDFFAAAEETQRELRLGDDEQFESDEAREIAGLYIAAGLLLDAVRILKAGTPSHRQISELLSLIGPFGAGQHCFNAWCLIDHGRIDGDYELFAAWVRRECRRAIACGRVKEVGQPRQRRQRESGQRDLFGEVSK